MNIFKKIKAFFTLNGKKEEINLSSAEIRKEGVFLHPIDDPRYTFYLNPNSVDIIINPGGEIKENDIIVLDNDVEYRGDEDEVILESIEKTEASKIEIKEEPPLVIPNDLIPTGLLLEDYISSDDNSKQEHTRLSKFITPKKRFSVMLYQDEYDMLIENIKEHGYKRAEYFLACMTSAKKQSLHTTYKQYTQMHEQRKKEDLENAKRAQTEEKTRNLLS